MKLLLDTHALLWWLDDPALLSQEAKQRISEGKNEVYVSAAVIWEMVFKKALGKLNFPDKIGEVLLANNFNPLPITMAHVLALQTLPEHHKDPFDRMLVAQAAHEGLTVVTRDEMVRSYSIPCIIA